MGNRLCGICSQSYDQRGMGRQLWLRLCRSLLDFISRSLLWRRLFWLDVRSALLRPLVRRLFWRRCLNCGGFTLSGAAPKGRFDFGRFDFGRFDPEPTALFLTLGFLLCIL